MKMTQDDKDWLDRFVVNAPEHSSTPGPGYDAKAGRRFVWRTTSYSSKRGYATHWASTVADAEAQIEAHAQKCKGTPRMRSAIFEQDLVHPYVWHLVRVKLWGPTP